MFMEKLIFKNENKKNALCIEIDESKLLGQMRWPTIHERPRPPGFVGKESKLRLVDLKASSMC